MIAAAIVIAYAAIGAAILLSLWRMVRGPDAPDRIIALDTVYINAIALFVLVGIDQGSQIYFEAGLLIAMMGFVGTVVLCRYVLGGSIID